MLALPLLACRPLAEAALRAAAEPARPNILFIMTDDHAAQAIGAHGSRVNTTPNLDRLARAGVRMDCVFATNSRRHLSGGIELDSSVHVSSQGHRAGKDTARGDSSIVRSRRPAAAWSASRGDIPIMDKSIAVVLVSASLMCPGIASAQTKPAALPHWTFTTEMIFPADRSLKRPEDGVVLPDGRLVVADQPNGLRVIHADGSGRPFGRFADAGYRHSPPEIVSTINGVTLEPAGTHILGADVFRGGIYRVNVTTEAVELVYQHPFGVNMARGDRRGGIWFTQSTRNGPEHGERDLFRSVDVPTPDGALYYLPPASAGRPRRAVPVVEGLLFANGLALDEARGHVYVAETLGRRVLRFRMDTATGRVTERTTVFEGAHPDNIELDQRNRLWIALPISSEIAVLDLASGKADRVFSLLNPEKEKVIATIEARIKEGVSWLELFNPTLWEPAPGAMTGMILSPEGGTVYVTGLGNALIRLPR